MSMTVTNQTNQDYWFGPLHLDAGVGSTLTVDDTSDTSLYLTSDSVADAINNLYTAGKVTVTGAASPFPRPTGVPTVLHGDGAPEGIVFAPQGSLYMRRDNTGTSGLYTKTTGVTIDTGWAPINAALTQLYAATLAASVASIDITNISASYSHLLLVAYLRTDDSSTNRMGLLRFNGDSGANYDWEQSSANTGTAGAGEGFGNTSLRTGVLTGAGASGNLFSPIMILIPHYVNSSNNKAALLFSGQKDSTSSGSLYLYALAGFWRSNAAITEVSLTPGSAANFVAGCRSTLYGVL